MIQKVWESQPEAPRLMWADRWESTKWPEDIGPKRWWHSEHPSGYSVGEVDAGKYMACDPDGNGLKDADGTYLEWCSQASAKQHVNEIIEAEARVRQAAN